MILWNKFFWFFSLTQFFYPQLSTFSWFIFTVTWKPYQWIKKFFFRSYINPQNSWTLFLQTKKFFYFLANFFFYKGQLLIFSPPFYQTLTYSWNWLSFNTSMFFWTYYKFFFTHQMLTFNTLAYTFFHYIFQHVTNFFMITNTLYHKKLLQFSKLFNFFSFGLISTTSSLWFLSWPLIFLSQISTNYIFLINCFFLFKRYLA